MRTTPDPVLKAAMEEIKAVLKCHDIAGTVILSSADGIEFLTEYQASWSCCWTEPTPDGHTALRIRSTGLPIEQKALIVTNTVGLFFGLKDALKAIDENLDIAIKCLGENIPEIKHITRRI